MRNASFFSSPSYNIGSYLETKNVYGENSHYSLKYFQRAERERESKKISCNCFNARLDRESCYSSFRLSNSRAPDFELVLILSPLLPTCMYIHFGCSSLKPGHVTFLNNFPFLDIILPIKKQNLSLLSRSHIPVLFLLLNPIWKYLCTFQVVFNGRVICQEKMLIFNASIS